MSHPQAADLTFVPVYIVFGILFVIGIIVIVLVSIAHCPERCCKRCRATRNNRDNAVVSIAPPVVSQNYAVLEDHLHLVDSPDNSLLGSPRRRPITAQRLYRRRPSIIERGITLEFLPEDNTLIQLEGNKITKTKIIIEDRLRQATHYAIHKGYLDTIAISIYIVSLTEAAFENVKREITKRDREQMDKLTMHPRYVRYLGTCFNPNKLEAYIITDFVAGCTIQELWKNPEVRSLMELNEDEKLQAAADIADAVYFLHAHAQPRIHGCVGLTSVMIDGETHRAKLVAKEVIDRIEQIVKAKLQPTFTSLDMPAAKFMQERAPESLREAEGGAPDLKSDIWSMGATILQFLFDQESLINAHSVAITRNCWDMHTLTKQFHVKDPSRALKEAMEMHLEPSIVSVVKTANPRVQFLTDCLNYLPNERPVASFLSRGLHQIVKETRRANRSDSRQSASFLFPGRRSAISAKVRQLDPLIRQQIEWNVKQDSGSRRRAVLFGIRNYRGQEFKSLSVTPVNDIKDMTTLLKAGGFALGNTYENMQSRQHFEDIVKAYVEAVNKEPEEIDMLFVYFAGQGVQGLPKKLAQKRRIGIFLDRVGISHDLALVTGNETLFPVAKLQTLLAGLNSKVKRKVLILDIRLCKLRKRQPIIDPFGPSGTTSVSAPDTSNAAVPKETLEFESDVDWEVPTISEESLDRLTTMFTIYPTVEEGVSIAAVDSHPTRTNGFLTGCFINVIKDFARPTIEDLPKLLNDEMHIEAKKAKSFNGIQCKADYIHVGNDIWLEPFMAS